MGYTKVAPRDCFGRKKRVREPLNEEQRQRRRERERGKKRVRTPEQEARHKAAIAAWKVEHRGYRSTYDLVRQTFRKHLHSGYRLLPCVECGVLCKQPKSGNGRKRCASCVMERVRQLHWCYERKGRELTCPSCGVQWCGLKQSGNAKTSPCCSPECRRELARAHKRARKRKLRGTVNRLRVFNRDGWACRACGCATPRALMGTFDDNAPELDHIVPVSAGGEHSYANTQCLCRMCNGLKSDKPMNVFVNQWLRGGRGRVSRYSLAPGNRRLPTEQLLSIK